MPPGSPCQEGPRWTQLCLLGKWGSTPRLLASITLTWA